MTLRNALLVLVAFSYGTTAGFDGTSADFGDTSLQATSSNAQNVAVYASLDSTTPGRVVFVAINRSTSSQVTAINGQSLSGTATIYQMTATTAQGRILSSPCRLGRCQSAAHRYASRFRL